MRPVLHHAPGSLSQDGRGVWTVQCACGQWEQRRPSKQDAELAIKAHLARTAYAAKRAEA